MQYLINFDYGCGTMYDVVDVATQAEAEMEAHRQWSEGAQSQADYAAKLATSENLTDAGLDPEEYGFEPVVDHDG